MSLVEGNFNEESSKKNVRDFIFLKSTNSIEIECILKQLKNINEIMGGID